MNLFVKKKKKSSRHIVELPDQDRFGKFRESESIACGDYDTIAAQLSWESDAR